MNKKLIFSLIMLVGVLSFGTTMTFGQTIKSYPETRKSDQSDNYSGEKITDPYRWLEDTKNPETSAWVTAQNKHTEDYLQKIPFRKEMKARLTELADYSTLSVPETVNDKIFYLLKEPNKKQAVLVMSGESDNKSKIIIDPNTNDTEGKTSITGFKISANGKYLAYCLSGGDNEGDRIFVFDLKKMKLLPDVLDRVKFSAIAWKGEGFYYSCYNKSSRHSFHEVYYHEIGTSQSKDQHIIGSQDNAESIFTAETTDDERYLVISEKKPLMGNALYIQNLKSSGSLRAIAPTYEHDWKLAGVLNDSLLFLTNYEAQNYQVVIMSGGIDNVKDAMTVIKEPSDSKLDKAVVISKNHLVVTYLKNSSNYLKLFNTKGQLEREIPLKSIGTVNEVKKMTGSSGFYFSYTSFMQPPTVYLYDLNKEKYGEFHESNFPFNPENYMIKQTTYNNNENREIPMILLYKIGTKIDGKSPLLLFCKGSDKDISLPSFDWVRMLFVDQGGILAVTGLTVDKRTGNEDWLNLIGEDLNSAADFILKKHFTLPNLLAIQGENEGSLWVRNLLVQKPELFKVVLTQSGLSDMLRYHMMSDNQARIKTFGSSESNFETLLPISPLQNIKPNTNFPAILITTSVNDQEYSPAHSYKFAASLQDNNKGNNPVLLSVQATSTQADYNSISDNTDKLSFLMSQMGMKFNMEIPKDKAPKTQEPGKANYLNNPIYLKNKPTKDASVGSQKTVPVTPAPKK